MVRVAIAALEAGDRALVQELAVAARPYAGDQISTVDELLRQARAP